MNVTWALNHLGSSIMTCWHWAVLVSLFMCSGAIDWAVSWWRPGNYEMNEMKCPQCSSLAVVGYIYTVKVFFYSPVVTIRSLTVFQPLQDSSRQQRLASESTVVKLEQKILTIRAEQEAVLSSMGEEVEAACCSLLKNGQRSLKVFICYLFCVVRYAIWSLGLLITLFFFFYKSPTNAHLWMSVPLLIPVNESSQISSAYRFLNPSKQCCSPTHKETLHLICNLSCWKAARLASDWPNERDH